MYTQLLLNNNIVHVGLQFSESYSLLLYTITNRRQYFDTFYTINVTGSFILALYSLNIIIIIPRDKLIFSVRQKKSYFGDNICIIVITSELFL